MFLMIDNYDSFVYNLVRYFQELDEEIKVFRNDKISISDIYNMKPMGIIISPGPKTPEESGVSKEIFKEFKGKIPILGICLGHQTFAYAFGGKTIKGKEPVHGKLSLIYHDGRGLFCGLKNPFMVTRYHSLTVDPSSLPEELQITSQTEDGVIMGLRHKKYVIESLQFHPEAELTEHGHELLKNFIKIAKN
jgi:para-aminobenzoate synthetase component 2